MPIIFDFIPHLDLLYFAGYGVCHGDEYVEANRAAARDPRRRPGQKTIIDVRGVTAVSILPAEIYRIVQMDRELKAAGVYGDYRTAMIMRRRGGVEEVITGLYNTLVSKEGMGVRPFFSLEEALAWLGLEGAEDEIAALREELLDQVTK